MFEKERSRFLRGLSLFHGWLPFLLLYLVWGMGYDGRALGRVDDRCPASCCRSAIS